MKRVEYSPEARSRLKQIQTFVTEEYGELIAAKIIRKILKTLRSLEQFDRRGISVSEMFGIETDYRYLYTEHNYAFYRVENDVVKIIDILYEREDFMQTLFGITTLTDSLDEYE